MRCFVFGIWLLGACSVFAAENEPNAIQALVNMTDAMTKLNFQGTVAFLKNGNLETLKYFHAVDNGKQQERLLSLNSPLREVVRADGMVSCIFKNSEKILVDHRPFGRSFLIDLPDNIQSLTQFYNLFITGDEQVAMLPTYVVHVQPKDQFRYARKIWLEKQLFLPLKIEVYSSDNTTLQQVIFTDVEVKDQLAFVDLKKAAEGKKVEHIHKMQSLPEEQAKISFSQIPAGFEVKFFMRMTMHNSKQEVEHLLLTDGFSAISVYLDQEKQDMPLGPRSVGAINAYSKQLDNYLLTVMGEVPQKAVEYIANSIRLRESYD